MKRDCHDGCEDIRWALDGKMCVLANNAGLTRLRLGAQRCRSLRAFTITGTGPSGSERCSGSAAGG